MNIKKKKKLIFYCGILTLLVWKIRKEEIRNSKLQGENENLKDLVKGYQNARERDIFALGKLLRK